MKYIIYTDGSTRNNGSSNADGAYGYVILNEEGELLIQDFQVQTDNVTNQKMELNGCIAACNALTRIFHAGDKVIIYTDSAYIINCYKDNWYKKWQNNGWINSKKEPVANKSYWESLIPYFENPDFNFQKVKGHADNKWNCYVDSQVQILSAMATARRKNQI